MMKSDTIVFDRSRAVCDWRCPRKFFLEYKYDGKGIVPVSTQLELYLGTALHDALAVIANNHIHGGVDIDLIASTAQQQVVEALSPQSGEIEDLTFAKEQASLIEGLVRGFHKHIWPRLLTEYPEIVAIEQEVTYPIDDSLIFMSRPDLIVANPAGDLFYWEYKSTSSKKAEWINSWQTAVQLHSTCKAVEATLGRKVKGVIIQGLFKGFQSYNKQSSCFCYCYRKEGVPPFLKEQINYEYKAGFKRYPVWELEGGTKKWVDEMPEAILADQFPQSPPIFISDKLVNRFFAQQSMRQREIELACQMLESAEGEAKDAILDCAFEQHFSECTPSFGKPCGYRKICHGEVVDPLKEGWEYRTPHHELELEMFEAETAGE
jgi:hypothetical protein